MRILLLTAIIFSLSVPCFAQMGNGPFSFSSGWKVSGAPASTSQTLTAAQSGNITVINNGSGTYVNGATMTLPAATPKLDYSFVIDINNVFRVAPQPGDIINFSSNIAGSKLKNTSSAAGDSIEVVCLTTGKWSVKAKSGTWATDNNP